MNLAHSNIKIIVCVPYIRTFSVLVRTNQNIDVIRNIFPNINQQYNLIYWFNGSQIMPFITFEGAGITENSVIVVSFKTDNVDFNKFFISLSKYSNEGNAMKHIMHTNSPKIAKPLPPKFKCILKKDNFVKDSKKLLFIQKIKQLLNEFNFVREKNNETNVDGHKSLDDIKPLPILK